MICQTGNIVTHVSHNLQTLCCSECDKCNPSIFTIENLKTMLNQDILFQQQQFEQINEYYQNVNKCFKLQKERLKSNIKCKNDYKDKFKEFLYTGIKPNVNDDKWKKQFDLLRQSPCKNNVKQQLMKAENKLFEMIQIIRKICTVDFSQGLQQIITTFHTIQSQNLYLALKQKAFETQKTKHSIQQQLFQLKDIFIPLTEQFYHRNIISMSIFCPNIQHITFFNLQNDQNNSVQIINNVSKRLKHLTSFSIEDQFLISQNEPNLYFINISKLKINNVKSRDPYKTPINLLKHNFSNLLELVIIYSDQNYYQQSVKIDVSNLVNLKKLKVQDNRMYYLVQGISNLKNLQHFEYLNLNKNVSIPIQIFLLPSLKSVIVPFSYTFNQQLQFQSYVQDIKLLSVVFYQQLVVFLRKFKHLKRIIVNDFYSEGKDYEQSFLINCQNLLIFSVSSLIIRDSKRTNFLCQIQYLSKLNSKLLQLRIDKQQVGNTGAMIIGKHLKSLKFLSIKGQNYITNNGIFYLGKLNKIQTFILQNNHIKLLTNYQNLKRAISNKPKFLNSHQQQKVLNNNILIQKYNIKTVETQIINEFTIFSSFPIQNEKHQNFNQQGEQTINIQQNILQYKHHGQYQDEQIDFEYVWYG